MSLSTLSVERIALSEMPICHRIGAGNGHTYIRCGAVKRGGNEPYCYTEEKQCSEGGIYIERALKLIEAEMKDAALRMDDALFVEYWGESVPPEKRIKRWLEKADELAKDWTPSKSLFLGE